MRHEPECYGFCICVALRRAYKRGRSDASPLAYWRGRWDAAQDVYLKLVGQFDGLDELLTSAARGESQNYTENGIVLTDTAAARGNGEQE